MMHLTSTVALAALLLAGVDAAKMTPQGCFKNVIPPLEDMGEYDYQSSGYCLDLCSNATKPVMALFRGSNCLCGDELPPDSEKTDDDECTTSCNGFPQEFCGGIEAYGVFLTGLLARVPTYGDTSSRTSATSTPTAQPTHSQSSTATAAPSEGGGPNKAAIAAGVVVGVIAIAGIVGGAFFFLKYRKRKEVVEEYRRNATINSFVSGGKPYNESSTDSRLDSNLTSQRRQSNGSIADDQDFSRRILKVTNPDGY